LSRVAPRLTLWGVAVEIVLTKPVAQLPTLSYPGWDDFGQISATLNQLEKGQFRTAAVMADQMWRDDRFYAVMRKRLDALESVPIIVNPADRRAGAKRIANALGGVDDMPGRWDMQFPAPVLEDLIGWGILMGIGIGELIWKTDDEEDWIDVAPGTKYSNGKRLRWTSRLKVWNPQWVRWDWSTFSYKLMTAQGEITLPDVSENPRGDGKWVVWCPYGYHEAWKKGAVRAIARSITRRQWVDRDWSRHNEKNGLALDKAIVPAEAPADAKQTFFDNVANRNAETAVMCEQSADPTKGKFDVELVESTAKTWDTYEASKADVNSDIAIVLLGHNLTTEVKEGKGSLGMGGASAVSLNYLRKDAGIAMCLHQQVLTWDAEHNYGDPTLAPRPTWQVDPPEDEQTKADTLNKLGTGLAALKGAGAPIDDRGVLEAAGLPTITVEEQAARDAIKAEEDAAAAAKAGGGPGNDDGGDAPPPKRGKAKMGAAPIFKRVTFAGLPIAVENPKGSTRYWRDDGADGAVTGSTQMQHDYGYIEGHVGADGEGIDCYLGPDESASHVHVVHQLKAPDFKKYDEDKVMIGWQSQDAARAAYLAHRDDGDRALGDMSSVRLDVFKAKLQRRTGTGKIRAGSAATVQALAKLVARANDARQLAARTPSPKNLKWADRLQKAAAQLGVRALAIDVASLRHEIDHATDFADLEKRLQRAHRGMDPESFAGAVAKTRILANLGGRLSAHKQVGGADSK
jgi:hypothetical protein